MFAEVGGEAAGWRINLLEVGVRAAWQEAGEFKEKPHRLICLRGFLNG